MTAARRGAHPDVVALRAEADLGLGSEGQEAPARFTDGHPIGADALAAALAARRAADEDRGAPRPAVPTRAEFVGEFERLGGSVHALARPYRRDRRQIYRWIAAFGLDGDST